MGVRRGISSVATGATAVSLAALTAWVALVGELPGDGAAVRATRSRPGSLPAELAQPLGQMTRAAPLLGAAAVTAAVLALRRRPWSGAFVTLSVGGALVLNALLKQVVERPRPALLVPVGEVSEFAYPAGHAAGTAALAAAAVLLAAGGRWYRPVLVGALALLVLTAGSQLVLARHYPSDLLGGWLLAAAWAAALWSRGSPLGRRARQEPSPAAT